MIVHPQPSGSKAVYMHSIMEDMSADQLRIIERDVLFDKTAGPELHHRINADDPLTPYWHLVNRTNKFARVLDGEENYVPDRVIQRNNLRWSNNKYVIPMRLLTPFFSMNSEISMDLIIKFNIEQETKKLFEAIVADGGDKVARRPGLMRPCFTMCLRLCTIRTRSHQDKEV